MQPQLNARMRAGLALVLALPLAACFDRYELVATWYLVHDKPAAESVTASQPWEQQPDPRAVATPSPTVGTPSAAVPAPASAPAPAPASSPKFYVALLNRGTDPEGVTVHGVWTRDPRDGGAPGLMDGERNIAGPVVMQPGRLLILNQGDAPVAPGPRQSELPVALNVELPVRLYVRVGPKAKIQRVDVERPLPSTLPEEWWVHCPAVTEVAR